MAMYADFAAAASDGVLHYWDFDDVSLTITDRIGGWDATAAPLDVSDRPAASVTAADLMVPSQLGNAFDMASMVPASPAQYQSFSDYAVPAELPAISGAAPLSNWSVRVRFYWRGLFPDQGPPVSYYPSILWFANSLWLSFENDGRLYAYTNASGYPGTASALATDAWHEVVATYDGTTFRWFLNGVEVGSVTQTNTFDRSSGPNWFGAPTGNESQANAIVDEVAIWNRALSSAEVSSLWNGGTAQALVGSVPAQTYEALLDVTLPITAEFSVGMETTEAALDATLPISFSSTAYQDWLSRIPPVQVQEVYRLLITGAPDGLSDLVIGGISSWQATNQAGSRSSYLQAVIPAADAALPDIEARQNGELVIQKGYRFANGTSQFEEILRSRFDTLRPDRGQRALTVTVSGYLRGKQAQVGTRVLTGVRGFSSPNGKRRVRCDIDLFLQPGMTVDALGEAFRADFINYYVNQSDKFCEVGER